LAGSDDNKDQSYFLCQLSQEQLSKALFPIGDIIKPEVRKLAHEADLPSADKKDSQGICFVGKVDLPTFLQQQLKSVNGHIVEVFDPYYQDSALYQSQLKLQEKQLEDLNDEEWMELSKALQYQDIVFETETYRSGKKHIKKTRYKENPYGKIIGEHDGAQFYTIGQRKGLNVGGHKESIFVISTDIANNIIYVGEGHNHKGLLRKCLRISPDEIHWVRPDLQLASGEKRRVRVRIRYRQPLQEATLVQRDNALFIYFDEAQRGITPGQFAVWYEGEELTGSGVIAE
jgi:tRNA-specific 2-thiouridylase